MSAPAPLAGCGVTAADVAAAAARLAGVLPPTPLLRARCGSLLKLENLQVTGAYKVRGAFNALARQVAAGDRRPVVAASAGNHALGVAWAARRLGLAAHAVVPAGAPAVKTRGAAALGAEVTVHGADFDAARRRALALSRERDWRFLPAFDDPDVIAGQGTVGAELAGAEIDTVLVPLGGGGLAAGMGVALKPRGVRLIGVQVEGVDAMRRALAGLPARPPTGTIADGLRVREPGRLTRRLCRALLDEIVVVSEAAVRRAMVRLLAEERLLAEGAGAAALAALPRFAGPRTLAVVSGGNLDLAALAELLAEREADAARSA